MKSWFSRSPALGIRLVVALILSLLLILADGNKIPIMVSLRNVMENGISLVYYFANAPHYLLDGVSENFVSSQKLRLENKVLTAELKEKEADLLLLDHLKVENQRLRLLLNSPLRQDEYKKLAQVINAENDNYHQQLVINQGSKDGAFVGQPVIDENGVVGQIISTGEHTSRVLLITDVSHSIPVQVLRNGTRMIATGTGHSDELTLDNVPRSTDIKVGDLLVTSGLSGRFPEGFPVATVEKIERNQQNYFATITAKPQANIAGLRDVLLVWPTSQDLHRAQTITPDEVKDMVKERFALQEKKQHSDLLSPATSPSSDDANKPLSFTDSSVDDIVDAPDVSDSADVVAVDAANENNPIPQGDNTTVEDNKKGEGTHHPQQDSKKTLKRKGDK